MWVFKPRKINHIFTSLKEDEEEVEDAEDEKENQSIEPPKLTTPIENKSQIIVAPAAVPSAEPAPSPTTEPKPNLKEGDNGESGNVKEVDAPIPIETRRRVVEAFYNDHIDDVIRQYYGAISKKELTAIRARLRRILAEQEIRGERMDLDAAIMLDHSRTQ